MPLYDNHMHTSFSGDGQVPMKEMVIASKKKGLRGITLTDHLDLDYYKEPGLFDLDIDNYRKQYEDICSSYNDSPEDFQVLWGLELGLQPHLANRHKEILDKYPFDYVIGSSHQVHKLDPYYPDYFKERGPIGGVREYFESIIENIDAFHDFDAYGHLDYVLRYSNEAQEKVKYEDYRDLVKEILSLLIKYDKSLEINTGAFRCGLSEPNPSINIIKEYKYMGGKLITLGADAHKIEHIAIGFDKIPDILQECGFNSYYVYKNRIPSEIKI